MRAFVRSLVLAAVGPVCLLGLAGCRSDAGGMTPSAITSAVSQNSAQSVDVPVETTSISGAPQETQQTTGPPVQTAAGVERVGRTYPLNAWVTDSAGWDPAAGITSDGLLLLQRPSPECGGTIFSTAGGGNPQPFFERDPGDLGCAYGMVGDERFVVWESDQDFEGRGVIDWTIWSYDRVARKVRRLASWSDYGSEPVGQPWVVPDYDQGLVTWSAVLTEGAGPVVFLAEADGSRPAEQRTVDATASQLAYPDLYFVQLPPKGEEGAGRLVRENLATNERRDLGVVPPIGQIAAGQGFVALTGETGVKLLSTADGSVLRSLSSASTSGWPAASGTTLVWSDVESSYVYDFATDATTQLGTRASANWVEVAGRYAYWYEARDPTQEPTSENLDLAVGSLP